MGEVVYPAFSPPRNEAPGSGEQIQDFTRLHAYGEGAGCVVGLTRNGGAAEPTSLGVLVGLVEAGAGVEVARLPDSAEGEAEAERIALAILRTLMMIDGTYRPWEDAMP